MAEYARIRQDTAGYGTQSADKQGQNARINRGYGQLQKHHNEQQVPDAMTHIPKSNLQSPSATKAQILKQIEANVKTR